MVSYLIIKNFQVFEIYAELCEDTTNFKVADECTGAKNKKRLEPTIISESASPSA